MTELSPSSGIAVPGSAVSASAEGNAMTTHAMELRNVVPEAELPDDTDEEDEDDDDVDNALYSDMVAPTQGQSRSLEERDEPQMSNVYSDGMYDEPQKMN